MKNNTTCIRVYADKKQIERCRKEITQFHTEFDTLSRLLALAGNSVRLKILYLLYTQKELCPCDLSDILQMSIPAVSQHLRKLKDANIVSGRRVAQTIFYSIQPQHKTLLVPFFKTITSNPKEKQL